MIQKFFFWLWWLPLGLIAVLLGVNNRAPVDVVLDPTSQGFLPTVTLPLFLLCFICLLLGLFLGSYLTWKRQGTWRSRARQMERENKAIAQDMQRVKLERAALIAPHNPPLL
jgi:Lipopolysaccharide assembly protein A domain